MITNEPSDTNELPPDDASAEYVALATLACDAHEFALRTTLLEFTRPEPAAVVRRALDLLRECDAAAKRAEREWEQAMKTKE